MKHHKFKEDEEVTIDLSVGSAQSPSLLLILSQNKQLPFLLGLFLALVIGALLYSEEKQKEELLQNHKATAALLDYGQKPEQGGLIWHQAIDDAKKLNNKEKLIADMYVRAAADEATAATRVDDKYIGKSEVPSDAEIDRIRKSLFGQQELDLKAALKIYKQIPDTKAEQLSALEDLASILRDKMNKLDQSRGPRYSPDSKAVAAKLLESGLSELKSSQPDLGFSTFHRYLELTKNSRQMRTPFFKMVDSTKPGDTQTIARLIPIMLDVTYYSNDSVDDLKFEHTWLDWALSQAVHPKTFEDKVNFADHSQSINGAIIGYLKCLSAKDDVNVRTKLIAVLKLARKADFKTDNPTEEYIDCLEKIRKLDMEAFGENAIRTRLSTQALGIAYGANCNFEAAEVCLKSIKPNLKLDTGPQLNVAYNLADIYAREGKFDLALAEYSQGQKYEKELHQAKFGSLQDDQDMMRFHQKYGIWARIATVYIAAGRYKEAIPSMQQANAEVAPDCFSGSGSSGGSFIME